MPEIAHIELGIELKTMLGCVIHRELGLTLDGIAALLFGAGKSDVGVSLGHFVRLVEILPWHYTRGYVFIATLCSFLGYKVNVFIDN